jgi:hypothetical protein
MLQRISDRADYKTSPKLVSASQDFASILSASFAFRGLGLMGESASDFAPFKSTSADRLAIDINIVRVAGSLPAVNQDFYRRDAEAQRMQRPDCHRC